MRAAPEGRDLCAKSGRNAPGAALALVLDSGHGLGVAPVDGGGLPWVRKRRNGGLRLEVSGLLQPLLVLWAMEGGD